MANMLYNGVELPDLSKVWTDKATYPYAIIFRFSDGIRYMAVASTQPFIISSSYFLTIAAEASMWLYMYNSLADAEFKVATDAANSYAAGANLLYGLDVSMSWGWTNHDVFLPNGSVYMEASEPIPVDGSGDDEGDTNPEEKHYCRINGTVYEVEGGTANMGGTFCEVKSGTVLIGGTVYDFALN